MKRLFRIFKEHNIGKGILITMLILFVSILTIVVIPIMINEAYQSGKGYYTLWEAKDVLAFYSVILSGIITFVALYFTIKHSDKTAKNQTLLTLSMIKQPFFVIDCIKHQDNSKEFLKDQFGCWYKDIEIKDKVELHNTDKKPIIFEIRNIGDGIALSTKYNISMFAGDTSIKDSVIKADNIFSIEYNLEDNLKDKYVRQSLLFNIDGEIIFHTYINITYQNTMGIEYKQQIEINLCANNNMIRVKIKQISPQSITKNKMIE